MITNIFTYNYNEIEGVIFNILYYYIGENFYFIVSHTEEKNKKMCRKYNVFCRYFKINFTLFRKAIYFNR